MIFRKEQSLSLLGMWKWNSYTSIIQKNVINSFLTPSSHYFRLGYITFHALAYQVSHPGSGQHSWKMVRVQIKRQLEILSCGRHTCPLRGIWAPLRRSLHIDTNEIWVFMSYERLCSLFAQNYTWEVCNVSKKKL